MSTIARDAIIRCCMLRNKGDPSLARLDQPMNEVLSKCHVSKIT